jgi:hypothetical protein
MVGLIARKVEEQRYIQVLGGENKRKRRLGRLRSRGGIILNWVKKWDWSNEMFDLAQAGTEGGLM